MSTPTPIRHILILSVSAGAGHIRAAEALVAAAAQAHPDVKVTHADLMTLMPAPFKRLYTKSFLKIVERAPALWGYLYDKSDKPGTSLMHRMRRTFEHMNLRRFKRFLMETNPDCVICTHFLPAEILSRHKAKGGFDKPLYVQVTDFDIHSMWIHDHVDGYFAASDEVATRMKSKGIPGDRIRVTGIPIMPVFSTPLDRDTCAAELGLDPRKTTFLMMSGGAGLGGTEKLAERLLASGGDFQLVVLAGRNEALLKDLRDIEIRHPGRIHPMGFTRTIERIMACSDMAITKPGGLTTSECLAMGLPMLVVSPIPGQEERNADFLLEQGVALKAIDAGGMLYRVASVSKDPARLIPMRERMRAIARPRAAFAVLEHILG